MATKKISELAPSGVLTGAEIVPIVKDGVTSQTTTQAIADLASGGGGSVPLLSSFTSFNSDGLTGTQVPSSVAVKQVSRTALASLSGFTKAAPSTPYTVTARLTALCSSLGRQTGRFAIPCLLLRDSVSGKCLVFGAGQRALDNYNSGVAYRMTNSTTYSAKAVPDFGILPEGAWYRFSDDGTTRKYQLSSDGVAWVTLASESSGTFLTENQVGFGIYHEGMTVGAEFAYGVSFWEVS